MKQHAPQQGDCEALLRTVTQDLPGPFYRCDPDGRLVFVNDACCDCFGKSREQLIGRDLFELIPGPERAAVRDRLHRLRAEDPAVSQEHTVIAADGSARSLRWHNRAICDAHGEVVTLQGYGEDVTALRQAELKLRLVTETIDDVFWMSTPGIEKIIYVSPAYETLWERSCESLYQSPKSFLDAVHPDDRDGFIRTVSESHRHCRPYSYDYRIVKRNGDIRWIRERGFPVNRELEGSRVMLGVCTDMTEIFLAREQLTESNRRMSALMSNLPGMAYRCLNDTNWTVTFVSEGCEELTGYPADALLDNHSVSYAQLIHADDRERVWREVQAALEEGGRFELSYRLINPAGEEKWVCEHGVPVYAENGELLALEGVILDDDERKRAEFSLQENERKYRALFDNAPLSYQSLDRNGTIIDVNPAWLTTLGYDRDEVIGRYFGDFMPPEWRDRFRQRFSEFRKNGRVSGVHLCLKHRQGHYLDVLFEGCIDYTLAGDFRQTYCVFQDITERRKAENRLAESESRFRAFFDNAGVGIAEIETASGRFLCANRRFFEMFGYSAAEMASLDFRRLTYDDDLQRNLDNLDRLVAGEIDSFSMDKRCTRKDGSQIWTNVAVTPLWSPGETSGHHIAVVEDIDARKRAEESARTASEETALMLAKSDEVQRALLSVIEDERQGQQALMKSRERYRSVVSSIKEVIFQTDTDGRWLFLNPAWTEVTGYDVDESLGTPFLDYLHPDERQRIEALFASLISQEKDDAHQEVRYLHKTGGIRWIEADARTSVNDDGVIAGVSGTLNDITERKHMEDRLRKLAQAVEQSPENIVITNLDAEIEYVNQAFLDTTGYGLEDVIGANTKILQSGKTPRESYRRMWASLSKGEQWKGEFVNRRKNGDEYIEFARIAPLRGPDGTVTHYVAVKEDITEKKRVASELDEHRHHLEDLVEKRTAELADARQRAEAANQAKSSFLANMSHEIRTPMNAIIGLTHLLQNAGPPPEQSMRLSKIDAAAGHLLAIINDILDISKIEAGKLVLEQSDFHLDAIFDHIRSLLREQARGKGLDLEIERNAVPQWLRGDPTRLRQALLNYAANAIKFTEQGTIHLRSNLLASNDDDLLVRFEVQDTGIGIEQDKLSHLFQTFEQADASTTRKRGGTGLGLAITKHLARLMGGEVGAQSEPGQGSTFWFTAKLQRGRGIRQEPALMLATGAETALRNCCSGSRILLAEDNVINREVALELLNGAGMEVDTAENGREAVEMVRAGEYDLVLMDVQMPEMDGLEATQLIRTMDNRGAIPVLAMTANIFEDDRRACSEAGMNDFIAKPVNPGDLYRTLIRWLPNNVTAAAEMAATAVVPVTPNAGATDAAAAELYARLGGLGGVDTAIGLRNVRGDAEVYLRLLRQFDAGHGDDMTAVMECIDVDETGVAVRLAHTLKGAAGALGLCGVQQAAKALEAHLRRHGAGDAETAGRLMAAVRTGQRQLHAALARLQLRGGPAIAADPAAARAALERLAPLLASDDTRANSVYSQAEPLLIATIGEAAERLGEHIAKFDYPAALKTLDAVLNSSAGSAHPATGRGGAPIDRQALTGMLGSDSARHFAYLRKFQPHAETIMTQIRQAYAARDAEQIAFFAHKLKSSARTVGANALADLCETLESAARNSNWTEIDGHVPALATVMRQVKEYIDEQ